MRLKKDLVKFFATGAWAGCSPVAPGTVGTLWGVAIAWLAWPGGAYVQAPVVAAVFLASVYLAGRAAGDLGDADPSSVVCDEITGVLVAFFLLPFTPFNAIMVFILFRIFDILKPWPVSTADRRIKGGFGIVADDVVAGVYANICARGILWYLAR